MSTQSKIAQLAALGVRFPHPGSVHIDESIPNGNIAPTVTIHPGCRILNPNTTIGPGSTLGEEAPVTLDDCRLGADVQLKGGYFAGSTLLHGVTFGSGAHVRAGCLLEEFASCAHCVGLKQTVLMPFVTLGSLINFCDCLMAGGTGSKNHGEVGSSFIHFNFTPNQDKATASLIGDVPRGVRMDQPPIFLGGQGGLVGPVRLEYGTVMAAGTIGRRDVLQPGMLVAGRVTAGVTSQASFPVGTFRDLRRKITNNLIYIGNIIALRAWYSSVRSLFMQNDPWSQSCLQGAANTLNAILAERRKRLAELAAKAAQSPLAADPTDIHATFARAWPAMNAGLDARPAPQPQPGLITNAFTTSQTQKDYIQTVKSLSSEHKTSLTAWLDSIVTANVNPALAILDNPSNQQPAPNTHKE